MHDLLNDLAKFVCGDICFRLGVDRAKRIPRTTRHLSFSTRETKDFDGLGSLHAGEMVHTFMPADRMNLPYGTFWQLKVPINDLLAKFKFLRVLSLSGCDKLTEVPQSVGNLIHLCSLDLSETVIEKLPESTCSLSKLQILKLGHCSHLKELPSNLHRLTNLRSLDLSNTGIDKLPKSIFSLNNLQILKLDHCSHLKELPSNLHRLTNLRSFDLSNTGIDKLPESFPSWLFDNELSNTGIDKLPQSSPSWLFDNELSNTGIDRLPESFPSWLFDNSLSNVVSLKLVNCRNCQRLPSLGHLTFLKDLEIANLDGIVSVDADFYGSEPFSFTSLETLRFNAMKEWERWECKGVTGAFPRLQHLCLRNCPKLIGDLPVKNLHLKELYIYHCQQLETCAPKTLKLELHDSGKLQLDWPALKRLEMGGHNMEALLLEMFGHNSNDTCLEELVIYRRPKWILCGDCSNRETSDGSLKTFPLHLFPKLKSLSVKGFPDLQMITVEHAHNHLKNLTISECPRLESLPERMDILLSFLESLSIKDCPIVKWVPGGYLPSNLKRMTLNNCSKLIVSLKGAFDANPSLEYLIVANLEVESFPDEGLLPLSLTSLYMWNCGNLKNLEYKGLSHLSSLKLLRLIECPKLKCLPEEGLPKSISYVEIVGCPLLKQCCQELTGEDWAKIAHIRHLIIS